MSARWTSVAGLAIVLAMTALSACTPPPQVVPRPEIAPRTVLARGEHLIESRRRLRSGDTTLLPAYQALLRDADEAIRLIPVSVAQKQRTPPSGDKRDYMSMAPYWWPDSTKPGGLPFIQRDGQVYPPSRTDHDGTRFVRLAESVEVLALAHFFTGNANYAQGAARQLRAFFLDSATRMSPHLEYAQAIMGINSGRGIGMIEVRRIPDVLDAIRLIEGSGVLSGAEREGLQRWFQRYLDWALTSKNGRDERAQQNNHGTWYDSQIGSIAVFLGDSVRARELLERDARRRLDTQYDSAGWQPEEMRRTRPLHYSLFNLEAFVEVAELARHVGGDLWNYRTARGGTILDVLRLYARFADTTVKFPKAELGTVTPDEFLIVLRPAASALRDRELEQRIRQHLPASLRRTHRSRLYFPTAP